MNTFLRTTAIALVLTAAPLTSALAATNAGLEELVRSSFADRPEMIPIAKCESGFRQFAPSGDVLRGGPGGRYVGLFQIDEPIHSAAAAKLGFDILLPEGNIGYARRLFDASGTNPWKNCARMTAAPTAAAPAPLPVAPTTAASTTDAPFAPLTANLVLGTKGPQVHALQRLLNAKGFTVAASGPGSPGGETSFFGALTRDAVRRFQCAKEIACDGNESTTGYGRVGPRTRAALNALAAR